MLLPHSGRPQAPPKRGQEHEESPAGALRFICLNKLSCCFSTFSCTRIYCRTVASSRPTVLTQYLRDKKSKPVTRRLPAARWRRTALFPFKKPITNAILCLGGTRRSIWNDHPSNAPQANLLPFGDTNHARSLRGLALTYHTILSADISAR